MYVVAVVSWCKCSSSSFRRSSGSCGATFIAELVPPLSSVGGWGWLAEDTCNYWRDTCICYNGPPLHPAHQLWTTLSLNGGETVVRGEVFLFVELRGGNPFEFEISLWRCLYARMAFGV